MSAKEDNSMFQKWTDFYRELYYIKILHWCQERNNLAEILNYVRDLESQRRGIISHQLSWDKTETPLYAFCEWIYYMYQFFDSVAWLEEGPCQTSGDIDKMPSMAARWTEFYKNLYHKTIIEMLDDRVNFQVVLSEIISRESIRLDNDKLFQRSNLWYRTPIYAFCQWTYHAWKFKKMAERFELSPPNIKEELLKAAEIWSN